MCLCGPHSACCSWHLVGHGWRESQRVKVTDISINSGQRAKQPDSKRAMYSRTTYKQSSVTWLSHSERRWRISLSSWNQPTNQNNLILYKSLSFCYIVSGPWASLLPHKNKQNNSILYKCFFLLHCIRSMSFSSADSFLFLFLVLRCSGHTGGFYWLMF